MVIKEKKPFEERSDGQESGNKAQKNGGGSVAANLPYLGRSVRIVGDWKPVEASSSPHEKNKRKELGDTSFQLVDKPGLHRPYRKARDFQLRPRPQKRPDHRYQPGTEGGREP